MHLCIQRNIYARDSNANEQKTTCSIQHGKILYVSETESANAIYDMEIV